MQSEGYLPKKKEEDDDTNTKGSNLFTKLIYCSSVFFFSDF